MAKYSINGRHTLLLEW